jgi:transcriptional regulator with XRE-family HTH domain
MATGSDTENRRRGFWLREARVRRGLSQQGVAEYLGLSSRSKSTISDWEKGVSEPRLRYLKAMAELYNVPLDVFTQPEPTAEERLDELVSAAGALEREDWDAEQGRSRPSGGGTGDAPRRRSA